MTALIPDVSVAATWCFADEATPFTEGLLEQAHTGAELVVPVLWRHEVANALVMAARKGRVTEEQITAFLDTVAKLSVVVDEESWERATEETRQLAVAYRLTAYDAAYLELALRRGLPLASLDKELQKAAQAAGAQVLRP